MKTYIRILSYAPSWAFASQHCLFALLAIIFGTVNFTMLIPLLDVLFKNIPKSTEILQLPHFTFSLTYFKDLFNYYMTFAIQEYGQLGALQYVCAVMIVMTIISNLFRYLSMMTINNARIAIIQNLRNQLFRHLGKMHIGFYSNERKGDIMSRLTTDVQEVEMSVVNSLKSVFIEPAKVVIYFIILLYTSLKLTIFVLIFLPISGFIISKILKKLRQHGKESQELLGQLLSIIDETLFGMKVIKAFNADAYIDNKFTKRNEQYSKTIRSVSKRVDLASPVSEVLSVFVIAGLLLYGGSMIVGENPALQAPQFITYIVIFSQILSPIKALSSLFSGIQRGLAAADRVTIILDTPSEVQDFPNAKTIEKFTEKVVFKDVIFSYNEDRTIIKNISFEILKGKTVALVGASGSGKSTLADLLPRFYDIQSGEILIDDHNIKNITMDSLRQQLGIVTQESILFNDTIFNNIAFGNTQATLEDVIKAAKIANAHDFILQSPEGYETNIGDRGSKLSGGQRQRLSIARAVLKNPPILILDEATSALDSESEKLVQEALASLMKNRTALVIAHRLSTIQNADEILVMKEGEICERGNHEDLMQQNGMYRKLIEMQSF